MSVTLVTFGKKGARKEFALDSGPVLIGRKMDADLRIPLADVSRSHCEIVVNGDKVSLRDLGSSNGTFVNNQRVKEAVLQPGDRIGVGRVVFTVQIDGIPEDISPVSPTAKAAATADAGAVTETADDTDEFDIDEIGELDIDDLSDLDLDDIGDDDSGSIEEIGELEELDEADLVEEDDSGKTDP